MLYKDIPAFWNVKQTCVVYLADPQEMRLGVCIGLWNFWALMYHVHSTIYFLSRESYLDPLHIYIWYCAIKEDFEMADNLSYDWEISIIMIEVVVDIAEASGPLPRTVFIITFSGTDKSISTFK